MDCVFERPGAGSDNLRGLVELMRAFSSDQRMRFDETRARANIRTLMADETYGCIRVIALERTMVGYLVVTFGFSFEFGGPDAFLDEIYIDPRYRGRGIGTLGVAEAERICTDRGVGAVHLEVDTENVVARRVYQSAGFEDHHRLLMTKWLAPVPPTG